MGQRPVKLGIVGAGFFGQHAHIANYAQVQGCQIVALAAGRPQLSKQVAERYGIPRVYHNHEELLKDPEVEAVVVVTGRLGIGPVALDSLKAGKHVLTEKPMACTVEQAETLVKAQKSNRTYALGYMKRYDAGVEQAKNLLDQMLKTGELGELRYTRIHNFGGDIYCKAQGHIMTDEPKTSDWEAWSPAPGWVPEDQKQEFHQYLNRYSHDINLLRYLFGATPRVADVRFDHPVYKLAMLDFGSHSALFETACISDWAWDESVDIYFTKGRIRIELPPALLKEVPAKVEFYRGITPETLPALGPSWSFRRQAQAFIQDAAQGRPSRSSGADALEDIRLIETIWKMKLKNHA